VAKPTPHRDKWRIRWLDEHGKRQSAVFDEYKTAQRDLTYTGMRAGELAALEWPDIDFERRLITVQRSFDGPTKSDLVERRCDTEDRPEAAPREAGLARGAGTADVRGVAEGGDRGRSVRGRAPVERSHPRAVLLRRGGAPASARRARRARVAPRPM
jgi:integrase